MHHESEASVKHATSFKAYPEPWCCHQSPLTPVYCTNWVAIINGETLMKPKVLCGATNILEGKSLKIDIHARIIERIHVGPHYTRVQEHLLDFHMTGRTHKHIRKYQ